MELVTQQRDAFAAEDQPEVAFAKGLDQRKAGSGDGLDQRAGWRLA